MNQRPSKSDALYAQMRGDILALSLPPGSALRLPGLSERYNTGVTPIRDCLNRLTTEKLVEMEHNKGFRVAALSLTDLLDLERSRSTIEGDLFLRAMEQGSDVWEAGVIGAYHQLSALQPVSLLGTDAELALWNRRHAAFHMALIAHVDAPWMLHFHRQLTDQLLRYQTFIQTGLRDLSQSHPDSAPQAAEIYAAALAAAPHTTLYDVAMARDLASARRVMERHVNLSIDAFQKLSTLVPANTHVAEILRHPDPEMQL
ncbi:GntR family transcriptional regulator [Tateyamaria sp. ANG-S1]|uniref:GntR family transcriptional regulator n=1 Tax=Tateyamaria sp. ANG-S1 TaxID=1577905 RepID=UPI0006918922|nr:GntR family transcriptional regulator [Tateyamaria sp. ANG-S1]